MPQDYYSTLGVPHNAGDKAIRSAYRRLARKHHPDVNRNDPKAEARFKEINEAHEVLSDPEKRRLYDRFGHNWRQAQQGGDGMGGAGGPFPWSTGATGGFEFPQDLRGGFGVEDIMGRFFGGAGRTSRTRSRQTVLEQPVEITLEEAFSGATRTIQITRPGVAQPLRAEVTIPPGVADGARVRVSPGGQAINLLVSVRPHPRFQRRGADLETEVTVALADAMLGGEVVVPTLTGRVALTLPPGTQNGRTFRLGGQGMPHLRGPKGRGDLHVTVKVKLPTDLSEDEIRLVRQLKESLDRRGQGAAADPGNTSEPTGAS